ncbi:hypothetical protein [Azospirillum sp. TSO5]|uniref:hypothetical protein n=1 Tax=Azospirillum sp. TSO5 TaxID=716760 RepID=UPI000D619E42|nr:hypothetical protein [Azospirillum sp. TSO5]PWC88494.1 hypothetical protein TSO5_22695 [Azospirillum sp. TSO5]
MGARLTGHLRAIQADHPCLSDVRGPGLMIGVEIVDERRPSLRLGARPMASLPGRCSAAAWNRV